MAEKVDAREAPPPPPPEPLPPGYGGPSKFSALDVALRVWLFAACLVAVVVIVTSKETQRVLGIPFDAKFNYSPAFIYLVVALSVAGLYSIITALASLSVIMKPEYAKKFLLQFALWDAVMLGIVAAATGTAGGVAYVALKGNRHTGWMKICLTYGKFCRHVGSSIAVSLVASILLLLLVMLSTFSLYSRIRD